MSYHQITSEERYMISAYRMQGFSNARIARQLGRHRSTICREIKRNQRSDGKYEVARAISCTRRRRRESRSDWRFSTGHLQIIFRLLRLKWSPEQISGWLRTNKIFSISHATIYRYIWYDAFYGGHLYTYLRQSSKRRRKKYRSTDSRGVLPGKRHISDRPADAENKSRIGHWEIDTVMGGRDNHCIVTLVERKTKYTLIGKLKARTTSELNKRTIQLIQQQTRPVRSITADNGTEFHQYEQIESATDTTFYFATPHHSWERGLNENTNGLIRQYLPKGQSMADLTQQTCNAIANSLNRRPRKTLDYKTPEQCYAID